MEQSFPNWRERMVHEEKQTDIYKSALKKEREAKRTSMVISFKLNKEEQDVIDYMQGTDFFTEWQNPRTEPNIFDTKRSFLLKMHNKELRDNFLNPLNRKDSLNDLKNF